MSEDNGERFTRRSVLGCSSALLIGGQPAPDAVAPAASHPLPVSFVAGKNGEWKIDSVRDVVGQGLPNGERLQVMEGAKSLQGSPGAWTLRGVMSNVRYATQSELVELKKKQEGLGRPQSTRAALIPIKKSAAWWNLAQDQRRAIFEEQSHHNAIGLEYLPGIARRLHHSRDLGEEFDFLTWFEFAPEQSSAFETLVKRLRASKEWTYVEREVDIRLSRT